MNKQTSIEWLLSELEKVNYHTTEVMIMYANKLHKQEIISAYDRGSEQILGQRITNQYGKQYYNETFKQD